MKQVLFLHGGNSFSTYENYLSSLRALSLDYERLKYTPKWREWIAQNLPDADVLLPTMPNGYNAVYEEWVIYFEKIVPFLRDDFTLVGHSLGGMFLAKYLHDHTLPSKARRIIIIAARHGSLDDNGSFNVESAAGVERSTDEVHLFHSEDDPAVPYEDIDKFLSDIPGAITHRFTDRGHFISPTFPEILELLKQK